MWDVTQQVVATAWTRKRAKQEQSVQLADALGTHRVNIACILKQWLDHLGRQ